jgi:hypothetical protein
MNPMKAIRQLAALFLFLAIFLPEPVFVFAQSTAVLFFPETGHYVKGDFLLFYRSAPDPRLLFGYPITEEITSKDGKTVQYFQRARLNCAEICLQRSVFSSRRLVRLYINGRTS